MFDKSLNGFADARVAGVLVMRSKLYGVLE